MHFLSLATVFLSITTIGNAFSTDDDFYELDIRQTVGTRKCAKGVHVIAASGDGKENIGGYGLLGTLVTSVVKAIPGSTNVTLPYPKGSPKGVAKTEKGAKNMLKFIKRYHASCPKTRLVLLGYSSGAIITMNAICGASEQLWKDTPPIASNWTRIISAIVVYGDETRAPKQPYNRGSCTNPGRFPRTRPGQCKPFFNVMRSYCNSPDPQCCQGGLFPPAHFAYPSQYDAIATKFVKKRFLEDTKK